MHSISGSSIAGKYDRELDVDVEAGAREQLDRRVLERAFGRPSFSVIVIPTLTLNTEDTKDTEEIS